MNINSYQTGNMILGKDIYVWNSADTCNLVLRFSNCLLTISQQIWLFADDCVCYHEIKKIWGHSETSEWHRPQGNGVRDFNPSNAIYHASGKEAKKNNRSLLSTLLMVLTSSKGWQIKYLGVTTTDDLRWSTHVSNIFTNAYSQTGPLLCFGETYTFVPKT